MSTIKIKKVETRKDLERFIDFHYDLYKDNEYDVPTLFSDDLNTLSKDKNAAFEFSEAEYFMAFDGRGRMVGRVAAIINHRANKRWGRKCVRFGWIDFIDDINVSKALFDAVEKYGKSKGMVYHTGYVTIGTGCFFYLLQTDYTKADRTFCYFLKRRSRNSYSFQLRSLLFHFNLNMRSTVIYTILGCKDCFVPQHGSLQTVDSRRNLFDAKMPFGICRRAYS